MGVFDRLRGTDKETKAPPRSIVAAAMPMSGPGVKAVNRSRQHQTTEQWQNEAWYYFDAIGELRGPLVWIANAVSQADVHATELDPDTGKPTGPTEDVRAQAVAAQVLGGPSQRPGLLRLIALCWQCVGDVWISIRPMGVGKPDEWRALSGNKVKAKGESWSFTDPFTGMEITTNGARDRMIRAWSPHPNDQAKADSAVRPALPILREMEKASQTIASRMDSRLMLNGVWLVPEEADFPKGDFAHAGEALMDLLLTAAETSLSNPGQAAASVPIVLTMPGEQIPNNLHLDFATAFDAGVVELRADGAQRLAKTLDMPRDVAEGTQGESNHWSAWQVEESTYKIFIEPLLKAIGDVLTEHWFRPALVAMGMTPEQAAGFELGWDTTAIVARPDDTENLRDLHDRILISDEYMLTENGVPIEALPSDEERTRRLLEKWVGVAPTLLADPNIADAVGLDIEVQPVAAGVDATVSAGGELETPEPEPVQNALPGTQGQEPEPEEVPEGLVAAAELIVYDALSRAGGRLLTNQNRGQFKATPRHELHTVIAPSDPGALLEGSFERTDRTADAFGLDRDAFRGRLSLYTYGCLSTGQPHTPEALTRWISDFLR